MSMQSQDRKLVVNNRWQFKPALNRLKYLFFKNIVLL